MQYKITFGSFFDEAASPLNIKQMLISNLHHNTFMRNGTRGGCGLHCKITQRHSSGR